MQQWLEDNTFITVVHAYVPFLTTSSAFAGSCGTVYHALWYGSVSFHINEVKKEFAAYLAFQWFFFRLAVCLSSSCSLALTVFILQPCWCFIHCAIVQSYY